MSIIECKNLTKEYMSGENVVKAVDDVTVSFDQGEFCAVTGPSGSGKSTLLHLLSSLESPTSGEVIYSDKKLSGYNDNQLSILRRRRFGFVFQAYNLVQELTGYENIILPVMLDKKSRTMNILRKSFLFSVSETGSSICRPLFRAVSSRGSPLRGRSRISRPFCLRMSLRATLTHRAAERCFPCLNIRAGSWASRSFLLRTICMLRNRRKGSSQ